MMRQMLAVAACILLAPPALAADKPAVDPARVEAAIKAAFRSAPADWQPRLIPDETLKECAAAGNSPPAALFEAIQKREAATIVYPDDGKLAGDWKRGERLAQSGYGLRFTDYPARNPNGGNCFACHQLTRQEVSFGTIGPSLLGYGKVRGTTPEAIKGVYDKIYNPHATFACSLMPRFGTNKVLAIEQIKDLVALLMDPASPVNQ
jgi:L-cysteine S-thiosulfotransferase